MTDLNSHIRHKRAELELLKDDFLSGDVTFKTYEKAARRVSREIKVLETKRSAPELAAYEILFGESA